MERRGGASFHKPGPARKDPGTPLLNQAAASAPPSAEEETSHSAAALKLLQELGYTTPAAQGPAYWMFDGELLDERRRRLEAEQFGETTG